MLLMTPDEAKQARLDGGPGRPKASLKKEDLMRMTFEGGASAIRSVLYEVTKELSKSKPNREKVKLLYLKAILIGVMVNIEDAGIESLQKVLVDLQKKLPPQQVEPQTEENPFKMPKPWANVD
jgi:hypothetical protein